MITDAQNKFLTYIRTLMIFELRFKGEATGLKPVHIGSEKRDQILGYNARAQIQTLVTNGMLEVYEQNFSNYKKYFYATTTAGNIDFSLLEKREMPNDALSKTMIENLKYVDLPDGAPSTYYFDTFLKWRKQRMDLFVRIDDFGYRFHSPVTSLNKEFRANLTLHGMVTSSFDIKQSQPTILAHILKQAIGENEFTTAIDSGKDIYLMLQDKAGLSTRDEAKKKFFEIAFSKPSDKLAEIFGKADWIEWINDFKTTPTPTARPKNGSYHNNLAMLLQRTESKLMRLVWQGLADYNIPFLTVHDEVIVRTIDIEMTKSIFRKALIKDLPDAMVNITKYSEIFDKTKYKFLNNETKRKGESHRIILC